MISGVYSLYSKEKLVVDGKYVWRISTLSKNEDNTFNIRIKNDNKFLDGEYKLSENEYIWKCESIDSNYISLTGPLGIKVWNIVNQDLSTMSVQLRPPRVHKETGLLSKIKRGLKGFF